MDSTPPLKSFMPLIVVLLLVGGGGLFILTQTIHVNVMPRLLLYFLIVIAGTGLALPLMVYFNLRFPGAHPAKPVVVVRQALWVGIYAALVIWLLTGQVFSFGLALIFLVGFVAVEIALRLIERARFHQP